MMDPAKDKPEQWRKREARLDNLRVGIYLVREELAVEMRRLRPLRLRLHEMLEQERELAAWVLSNNPRYRSVLQRARYFAKTLQQAKRVLRSSSKVDDVVPVAGDG